MSALPKEEEQPTATKLASVWGITVAQAVEPIAPPPASNDVRDPGLTIRALIHSYKTDKISKYRGIRWKTKQSYDSLLKLIDRDRGDAVLKNLRYRDLQGWHDTWAEGGKVRSAGSKIRMVGNLLKHGRKVLEDEECVRLKIALSDVDFQHTKRNETFLTEDQVDLIRAKAHAQGKHSIAIANAFQFECTCRQKDIIGDWEPWDYPGPSSDTNFDGRKWLRGIRWEEINGDGILVHITSKKQKKIIVDLKNGDMVIEELNLAYPGSFVEVDGEWRCNRALLPIAGPIIISEYTGRPWIASEFRRKWRIVARACGIPDRFWNMHNKAGASTESRRAGAAPADIQAAAQHSNPQTTEIYIRGDEVIAEGIANTMKARRSFRKARRLNAVKASGRTVDGGTQS